MSRLRSLGALVWILAILGLASGLYAASRTEHPLPFRLREVRVVGASRTDPGAVWRAAGVEPGSPLFGIDVGRVRSAHVRPTTSGQTCSKVSASSRPRRRTARARKARTTGSSLVLRCLGRWAGTIGPYGVPAGWAACPARRRATSSSGRSKSPPLMVRA